MPSGDEGTGLHAFDDLDPVSTVSALNEMPAPPAAADGDPARGRTAFGGAPPPPPDAAPHPPPRAAQRAPQPARARSGALPPLPPVQAPDATPETHAAGGEDPREPDADTRVFSNSMLADAGASFEGAAGVQQPAREREGGSEAELLGLSSKSVATNIDMDWDEDEVQTKLMDESSMFEAMPFPRSASSQPASDSEATPPAGRPSPFPQSEPAYPGNPSPFAGQADASSSGAVAPAAGAGPAQSWEDDAMTTVAGHGHGPALPQTLPASWRSPSARTGPVADSLAPTSNRMSPEAEAASMRGSSRPRLAMLGLGAGGLLVVGLFARGMLASPDPATLTFATQPADAEVLLDGRPLVDQTSPFTVQGLAPDMEHTLVVRKKGFSEETHHFDVGSGETKALPEIELSPLEVDTGFALSSQPPGARILLDGEDTGRTTPARVTDLDPGVHVVRLVHGDAYQPWQTQVSLQDGSFIELPTALLVSAEAGERQRAEKDRPQAAERRPARREPATPARARATGTRRASRGGPAPSAQAGASRGSSAGTGSLRINSRPWSQVYVDGRLIGNTPQMNVPLPAGAHRVRLVNPQLGMSKDLRVRIQAGKATTKIVDMVE